MRVSNSKVNTYKTCQKKYDYRYNYLLESKKPSLPLSRGKVIHGGLELSLDELEDYLDEVERDFYSAPDKVKEELGYDFVDDMKMVLRNYHNLVDRGWIEELGLVETEIRVEDTLGKNLDYLGFIDGIVKLNGELWILERKTFSASPPTETALYNTQTALYSKLFKAQFKGVIFEYIRSKPPKTPKVLKSGAYSKSKTALGQVTPYTLQIETNRGGQDIPMEYYEEAKYNIPKYIRRMEYVFNPTKTDRLYKNFLWTARELRKKANAKYPKYTRNLNSMTCRMCEYRKLCFAELDGADVEYIIQEEYQPKATKK